MELTFEIIEQLRINMLDKAQARHLIRALDARIRLIYNELYNPNLTDKMIHMPTAKERKKQLLHDMQRMSADDPKATLKLAAHYFIDNVRECLDEELSAFVVTDDKSGGIHAGGMHVRLSFSSFCSHVSSLTPLEDAKKNDAKAQELMLKGYIINKKQGKSNEKYTLVNCDKNRMLLKEYLTSIGASHIRFEQPLDGDNIIYDVVCVISPEKYPLYEPPHKEKDTLDPFFLPKDHVFTPDEELRIRKLLDDTKFALNSYSFMQDSNTIPELLKSYMYELEGMYSVNGEIYREQDAKHRPDREQNKLIRKAEEEARRNAFANNKNLYPLINQIRSEIQNVLEPEGLMIGIATVHRYGRVCFEIERSFEVNFKRDDPPENGLFKRDELNDEWVIPASQENIERIQTIMRKAFPSFKFASNVECRMQNGTLTLNKMCCTIDL